MEADGPPLRQRTEEGGLAASYRKRMLAHLRRYFPPGDIDDDRQHRLGWVVGGSYVQSALFADAQFQKLERWLCSSPQETVLPGAGEAVVAGSPHAAAGAGCSGRVFWLQAPPGSGKTQWAVEACRRYPDSIVAHHFVDPSDPLRSTPHRLLRLLVYSLSRRVHEYRDALIDIPQSTLRAATRAGDVRLLWRLLLRGPLRRVTTLGGEGDAVADVDGGHGLHRRFVLLLDGLDAGFAPECFAAPPRTHVARSYVDARSEDDEDDDDEVVVKEEELDDLLGTTGAISGGGGGGGAEGTAAGGRGHERDLDGSESPGALLLRFLVEEFSRLPSWLCLCVTSSELSTTLYTQHEVRVRSQDTGGNAYTGTQSSVHSNTPRDIATINELLSPIGVQSYRLCYDDNDSVDDIGEGSGGRGGGDETAVELNAYGSASKQAVSRRHLHQMRALAHDLVLSHSDSEQQLLCGNAPDLVAPKEARRKLHEAVSSLLWHARGGISERPPLEEAEEEQEYWAAEDDSSTDMRTVESEGAAASKRGGKVVLRGSDSAPSGNGRGHLAGSHKSKASSNGTGSMVSKRSAAMKGKGVVHAAMQEAAALPPPCALYFTAMRPQLMAIRPEPSQTAGINWLHQLGLFPSGITDALTGVFDNSFKADNFTSTKGGLLAFQVAAQEWDKARCVLQLIAAARESLPAPMLARQLRWGRRGADGIFRVMEAQPVLRGVGDLFFPIVRRRFHIKHRSVLNWLCTGQLEPCFGSDEQKMSSAKDTSATGAPTQPAKETDAKKSTANKRQQTLQQAQLRSTAKKQLRSSRSGAHSDTFAQQSAVSRQQEELPAFWQSLGQEEAEKRLSADGATAVRIVERAIAATALRGADAASELLRAKASSNAAAHASAAQHRWMELEEMTGTRPDHAFAVDGELGHGTLADWGWKLWKRGLLRAPPSRNSAGDTIPRRMQIYRAREQRTHAVAQRQEADRQREAKLMTDDLPFAQDGGVERTQEISAREDDDSGTGQSAASDAEAVQARQHATLFGGWRRDQVRFTLDADADAMSIAYHARHLLRHTLAAAGKASSDLRRLEDAKDRAVKAKQAAAAPGTVSSAEERAEAEVLRLQGELTKMRTRHQTLWARLDKLVLSWPLMTCRLTGRVAPCLNVCSGDELCFDRDRNDERLRSLSRTRVAETPDAHEGRLGPEPQLGDALRELLADLGAVRQASKSEEIRVRWRMSYLQMELIKSSLQHSELVALANAARSVWAQRVARIDELRHFLSNPTNRQQLVERPELVTHLARNVPPCAAEEQRLQHAVEGRVHGLAMLPMEDPSLPAKGVHGVGVAGESSGAHVPTVGSKGDNPDEWGLWRRLQERVSLVRDGERSDARTARMLVPLAASAASSPELGRDIHLELTESSRLHLGPIETEVACDLAARAGGGETVPIVSALVVARAVVRVPFRHYTPTPAARTAVARVWWRWRRPAPIFVSAHRDALRFFRATDGQRLRRSPGSALWLRVAPLLIGKTGRSESRATISRGQPVVVWSGDRSLRYWAEKQAEEKSVEEESASPWLAQSNSETSPDAGQLTESWAWMTLRTAICGPANPFDDSGEAESEDGVGDCDREQAAVEVKPEFITGNLDPDQSDTVSKYQSAPIDVPLYEEAMDEILVDVLTTIATIITAIERRAEAEKAATKLSKVEEGAEAMCQNAKERNMPVSRLARAAQNMKKFRVARDAVLAVVQSGHSTVANKSGTGSPGGIDKNSNAEGNENSDSAESVSGTDEDLEQELAYGVEGELEDDKEEEVEPGSSEPRARPLESRGHSGKVTVLITSRCGRLVISGSADNTLRVWSTRTGLCVAVLRGHTQAVSCIACVDNDLDTLLPPFAEEGLADARAGFGAKADADAKREAETEMETESAAEAAAENVCDVSNGATASRGDRQQRLLLSSLRIVSGSWDTNVIVWNLRSAVELSWRHTPLAWDLAQSDRHATDPGFSSRVPAVRALCAHKYGVNAIVVARSGLWCISGSGSLYTPGELQMWRIAPAHSQRDAAQQLPPSNGESEGPVGSIIRTFGWPWSSQTGTTSAETQSTVAHLTGIMSLALAARDTVLVSSAGDNAAAVWDVHSGQCLQWCQGHVGWITCLAVSPHVRCAHDGIATKRIHFITGGHDGRALLWDTSASVGDASSNESVGADQNDVIIARSQFPCVLVRGAGHDEDFVPQSVARASCRHILRHGEAVNGCAFSGCGDFAFTSSGSKLLIWRVDNCEVLCQHPCPSPHEKIAHLSVSSSAQASLSCTGGSTPLAFGTTLGRMFTANVVFPPLKQEQDKVSASVATASDRQQSPTAIADSDERRETKEEC